MRLSTRRKHRPVSSGRSCFTSEVVGRLRGLCCSRRRGRSSVGYSLHSKPWVVPKVCRDRDPLVGAVGTRSSELNPFVRATLSTVLADVPHPAMRGDVDVADMVVAESVGHVVVDEVLLLLLLHRSG